MVRKGHFLEGFKRDRAEEKRILENFWNKVGGVVRDGYFCTPKEKRVVHLGRDWFNGFGYQLLKWG